VPEALAKKISACDFGLAAYDIVDAHTEVTEEALEATGHLYFRVRSVLGCQWLEAKIRDFPVTNQWTARAREALLDELYNQQGHLIAMIILAGHEQLSIRLDNSEKSLDKVDTLMDAFKSRLAPWIQQWGKILAEMKNLAVIDHPVATVALRELSDVIAAARTWASGNETLSCSLDGK
jgi:NAD-specific glutamate dehydrogenase